MQSNRKQLHALLTRVLGVTGYIIAMCAPIDASAHGIQQRASWHWQLQGLLRAPDRDVYDIDLFDTGAETVAVLKDEGRLVICYFSAGSYENWRPDALAFPERVKGRPLDDWPGEVWLDVSDHAVVRLMRLRLDLAVRKGCDGVEPDNIDGYLFDEDRDAGNDTGHSLQRSDWITYNKRIALAARRRGLLVGFKNALELASELEPHYDFALNESCFNFGECERLQPFLKRGKPVFVAEYADYSATLCERAHSQRIQLQFFDAALDGVGRQCP